MKITSDHFLPVDCQYGLARVDGFMMPVELVATEGVDRARARLEKGGGRMDEVKDEDGPEDVRSNWIDWDSQEALQGLEIGDAEVTHRKVWRLAA